MDFKILNLTVICLTKNRPRGLKQVLLNWQKEIVQIIVLDGSDNQDSLMVVKKVTENDSYTPEINYVHIESTAERFKWASTNIRGSYVIFNNDDDYVFTPGVFTALKALSQSNSVGLFSWRNANKSYVRRELEIINEKNFLIEQPQHRVEQFILQNHFNADAIWLSVMKVEVVSKALALAGIAFESIKVEDRLVLDTMGICFLYQILWSGKFERFESCMIYKRSHDNSVEFAADRSMFYRQQTGSNYKLDLLDAQKKFLMMANKENKIKGWNIGFYNDGLISVLKNYESNLEKTPPIFARLKGKIRFEVQNIIKKLNLSINLRQNPNSKPPFRSRIALKWLNWNFWIFIHRYECCRNARIYFNNN